MDVDQLTTLQEVKNLGLPFGSWANAPTLASATDLVNNSGSAQTVYVAGGTVTVIAVDGVTTGLTSGTFRVRNDSKINITYSSAPTVKWING